MPSVSPANAPAFMLWTVGLCHCILPPLLEGVSGYDGSSADAAPSVSQPAAGPYPPETTSPNDPAGIYAIIFLTIPLTLVYMSIQ